MTGRAAVARLRVDRHVAGVDLLVAQPPGARRHHLEIVVARQARNIGGAGDAELVLGARIERLEVRERERPVEQVGACNIAVDGARAELVLLEAKGRARPVHGRSAHGLAYPQGQRRVEIAGADALVQPAQAAEHGGIVVDDVG
jgi:hypothetical protein